MKAVKKLNLLTFEQKEGRATVALHFKSWCGLNVKFFLCSLFVIPFLFQQFKSWTLMIGSRFINQIPIRVLRSDPGDQASIKDTLWKKRNKRKTWKCLPRLTASRGRMRQMKRAKLNLNLSHTLTQSEYAFGIIHRRRMFILVSLFQKLLAVKVFCFKGDNDRQLTDNLFWSEFEHFFRLKEKSRAGGRDACIRGITSLNPWANHERKNDRFAQRTKGIVERILTDDL